MAPITRLEETNQIKTCNQLRRTIHRSISAMFSPYYAAYESLKPYAVEVDLDKYYDIYEISRMDKDDAQNITLTDKSEINDVDGLQHLKMDLQRLHMIRKLLLCTLLALGIDGSQSDFQRWSAAVDAMDKVSFLAKKMTCDIDDIMREEEGELLWRRIDCSRIDVAGL